MAKKELEVANLIESKSKILGRVYSEAYKEILSILDKNAGSMWRQDRSKRMLANLNDVLRGLDKETQAFIKKEVPEIYKLSAINAKADLEVAGVAVAKGFSQIHTDAIDNLTQASKLRFAESLSAVKRDVMSKIELARKVKIRETIAVGQTLGKASDIVAKEVKSQIESDGIVSLVDRAGKNWTLDRYSQMLTQELLAQSSREAVINIGAENGFDLYRITRHGATDSCRFHEGEVFSLTGKTPGYPTLDQLTASGEIFHVGCRHGYFIATDLKPAQEKQGAQTKERLDNGGKISNYDALKNQGKSAEKTLSAQEKRKDAMS